MAIYIVINLVRFKKWAWQIFVLILLLAIGMDVFYVLIMGVTRITDVFVEFLFYFIFWLSLAILPIFGIIALIRKIKKRKISKS